MQRSLGITRKAHEPVCEAACPRSTGSPSGFDHVGNVGKWAWILPAVANMALDEVGTAGY